MAIAERRADANRRNAQKSTGPRTAEGKAVSRRNGLKHGMAAEVLVLEGDREMYRAAMARWEREAGPDNVAEAQLVRRAAVASVRLERIERANEEARESAARDAVRRWEDRMQARARKLAQGIGRDPLETVRALEATAFGCDWLIRQWHRLDAPLAIGLGWDQRAVDRAQQLLGFVEGTPGVDGAPEVRHLWILAAALAPGRVEAIPRLGAEVALPTDPIGARLRLREMIAWENARLEALRDESWEAVEGPERASVAALSASADTSSEGQLRHRYEVAADRSCNAALRLFLNIRDRRRRELMAIAKEAAAIGETPRAPVGGGWWREVDSDPAPPGCARVGEHDAPETERSQIVGEEEAANMAKSVAAEGVREREAREAGAGMAAHRVIQEGNQTARRDAASQRRGESGEQPGGGSPPGSDPRRYASAHDPIAAWAPPVLDMRSEDIMAG